MTPEQAAKADAAVCKLTPGQPLHVTLALFENHLDTKERLADTLRWLRQYLGDGTNDLVTVPARECWNRLAGDYYDPHTRHPDEGA